MHPPAPTTHPCHHCRVNGLLNSANNPIAYERNQKGRKRRKKRNGDLAERVDELLKSRNRRRRRNRQLQDRPVTPGSSEKRATLKKKKLESSRNGRKRPRRRPSETAGIDGSGVTLSPRPGIWLPRCLFGSHGQNHSSGIFL